MRTGGGEEQGLAMLIALYKCHNFLLRPLGTLVLGVLVLASHSLSVH